jgi:hypothetical protein
MIVVWSCVIGLTVYCFARILTSDKENCK